MVENGKISDCAGRCKNSIFRSCDMLYYSFMDQSPERQRGKIMEEKKFNQIAYQNNYKREKYDKIEVIVPKGEKEHIKQAAKAAGLSVSAYIYKVVQEDMEKGGTV